MLDTQNGTTKLKTTRAGMGSFTPMLMKHRITPTTNAILIVLRRVRVWNQTDTA